MTGGAEAADRIRSSRAGLLREIDRVSPDAPVVGKWSVREVLGHSIGWVQLLLWMIDQKHPDARSDHTGVDDFNRRTAAEWSGRPLGDIRAEFERVSDRALALVERLSDEELQRPGRYEWDRELTLAHAISENSSGHFDEHAAQIRAVAS